jgi:hypothetical protein
MPNLPQIIALSWLNSAVEQLFGLLKLYDPNGLPT